MKTKRHDMTTPRARWLAAYSLCRMYWNQDGEIPAAIVDARDYPPNGKAGGIMYLPTATAARIIEDGRKPTWPDAWRPHWIGSGRMAREVWKDRLWRKHGDRIVERNAGRTLAPIMSALRELDRIAGDHYDDLSAFHAPSECYADEQRFLRRRFLSTLRAYRWGEETLATVLSRRVCVRWLHFHGPSLSY